MGRVLKRSIAKRDLTAQWVWYAENGGIEVADRFLKAVETMLSNLASQPQSGAVFSTHRPEMQGMLRMPFSRGFENILLFYFPLSGGVDLVRVVHGSRDLDRLTREGFFG